MRAYGIYYENLDYNINFLMPLVTVTIICEITRRSFINKIHHKIISFGCIVSHGNVFIQDVEPTGVILYGTKSQLW
jgi:hypothetical protein